MYTADAVLTEGANTQKQSKIKTTLYDLIEVISEEVGHGEDIMIVKTASHILNSYKIKFYNAK